MFLSKIWFILVAILAGVAITIALTAPRPMVQRMAELEAQRLDRAQYAAEQLLKVDAYKWIERVSKLGRDAVIAEALDSASRGSGELAVQHKTVQNRFKALIPDLPGSGIATLGAIDNSGRVVARVGLGEKDYGENLGSSQGIAEALKGTPADDVWAADGRLLRIAAAPVLSKNRERTVGALYVGAETGQMFADRLKKNLEVEVALLLKGKVVASTLDSALMEPLVDLVVQHRAEIDEVKRTPAMTFDVGGETLLAVAAPFPGQAAQQQGYYVVIGKKPAKSDLTSLLANTSARDLGWGRFPWIALGGTMIAIIVVGLLLQRLEVDVPVAKLRKELRSIANGEAQKLNDRRYSAGFGGIARDVNAAIEHILHTAPPGGETAGTASVAPGAGARPEGAFMAPTPPFTASTPDTYAGGAPSFPPPPPPLPSFAAPPPAPVIRQGPGPAPTPQEEEAHVVAVYEEFIATKQRCGESTAGLTLEKFRLRLQENKNSLLARHGCRTVRFSVYVKDGKASLRATPIK